ncbi:phage tail protein [Flavobacterium aquiphilum]|uniref:phage tail protein n=1 Tax=Flavobacterium aquiphilum TaxID=3003261 RepID=UPI002480E9E4|nr:tail fiber protein [Flavobacterium aquiphilum]
MDEYIGIVKLFAGNFAPKGWALCNGQILPISQNVALFSILGTTYGGDGQSTFALPNLQGAVPLGAGTRNGETYDLGEAAGTPSTSILTSNLPAHAHTGPGTIAVANTNSTASIPTTGSSIAIPGSVISRVFTPTLGFATSTPNVNLATSITTGTTGSNIPISIMQPYLAMNYIICTEGIFPSRN